MPVSYEGVLVNYCMQSPASCMWDFTCQKVYDIAAPAFDEAVDPGWWRPHVASVPAKEEELEFTEIPCIGEAKAKVLPTRKPQVEQISTLSTAFLQRQLSSLSLRQRCSRFLLPHSHKSLCSSKKQP